MSDARHTHLARTDWVLALALVLLAALPRLCCLNLAEFKVDEAHHYRMAYQLTRGAWRWTGSTASLGGIPKPPLLIYVLGLPAAFTRDPRIVTGFLGALAALANGLFYLTLRRVLGRPAALGAGLLFALNPQAILYARKLFTADLLPPLTTLFLAAGIALLQASRERLERAVVWASLTFALLMLTTFSPILLLPILALLFFERRQDLQPRHLLVGALALALPFLPYLFAVELRPLTLLEGTQTAPSPSPPLGLWLGSLFFGAPYPKRLIDLQGLAALLLAGNAVAGLLWLAGRARRQAWARFILVWVLLVPLLALIAPFPVKEHYLVILYPALFVLPASAVEWLHQRSNAGGWLLLLGIGFVAAWQGSHWLAILEDVRRGVEGYGTPLGYWWAAAEEARKQAEHHDVPEILLALQGDAAWDEQAAILDALLLDTPHRPVDGNEALVFPARPALLLVDTRVALADAAAGCTTDLQASRPASPFGGRYSYRLWSPEAVELFDCIGDLRRAESTWASGVQLLGYRTEKAPSEALVRGYLLWRTGESSWRPPEGQELHWFHHLLSREDERGWGQYDSAPWPSHNWNAGDRVLTTFAIEVVEGAPEQGLLLRVGQYTYPGMENVPVVDEAGNPSAYALDLMIID